jgi:formylmethanofuran dehydrogenase subunit B
MKRIPCTGCALLCDDIIVSSDGLYIDEVIGACLKGKERFDQITAKNRILSPLIRRNGDLEKCTWEDALQKVKEIITTSSKPLLYGFSNTSCEAQLEGIELARLINGFIDSNSSICQGKVLKVARETGMTFTTLAEMINKVDLVILWGANAAESFPRLLNKVLFSRGKFRMTGREIRTLIVVDPVKISSLNVMGVRDLTLQIDPDKDIDLIRVLKEECCAVDSIPSEGVAGIDQDDLKRLLLHIFGSENGVIFVGQGILRPHSEYNVIKELLELVEMINMKQEKGRISTVLLGGHYNMTGFDQITLSSYGKIGGLQFKEQKLIDTEESIVSKIDKSNFDCSIIVGSDPISHFPQKLSRKLASKPIIVIDNRKSATYELADVVLPTAITGVESGGLVYRLDHVPIELDPVLKPPSSVLSDYDLLKRINNNLRNY